MDVAGNVVVGNSGCDAVTVLNRETGLSMLSLPVPQAVGVFVTETNTIVVSSTAKHLVSIY